MWRNYGVVAKLEGETEDFRRALFLHTLGADGLRVYNGLQLGNDPTVQNIIDAFETHFVGRTNVTYERFVFNKRDQKKDESIEDYVTELRTLSKTCNFTDDMKDSLLRDRIVIGIRDQSTREKLLQERDLTLQLCIDKCRSAESTTLQMKAIGEDLADAHAVRGGHGTSRKSKFRNDAGKGNSRDHSRTGNTSTCKFCGQTHVMKKELCPAYKQTCKHCKKMNHFEVVCMQKRKKHSTHTVLESGQSEDEMLLAEGEEIRAKLSKLK